MKLNPIYAAIMAALIALPAYAVPNQVSTSYNPTAALGLTFTFSRGKIDTGVGLRVISSNQANRAAATIGLDYMFTSKRFRPTLGVAYMGNGAYFGADVGFGLNGEGFDFGLGLGSVNTKEEFLLVQ